MQFGFPRRWLFPTPDRWLAELPWYPDIQVRLIRNGPLVHHSGRCTTRCGGSCRRATSTSRSTTSRCRRRRPDERRQRVTATSSTPEQLAYGGGLLNPTMYVPEDTATSTPLAVPGIRPAVDRCGARGAPSSTSARRERRHRGAAGDTTAESAATSTNREPPSARARSSVFAEYGRIAPGECRPLYVIVTKRGEDAWPWGPDADPLIAVGYRWSTGGRRRSWPTTAATRR